MKIGIRLKLISFIIVLLIIIISFLSILVLKGIENYQDNQIEDVLFKQKDMFEQYFNEQSQLNEESNQSIILARGSIFNKPWLRTIPASVYDTNGILLSGFRCDGRADENSDKASMISYAIDGKVSYKKINSVVYFYSPIKYKEEIIAVLELEYPVEENEQFYNHIKIMFYITGIFSLLLGTILGIIYFSKLTQDIYKMKYSIDNIKKGNFHKVEIVKRNDEIGDLSNGLADMSNTIEQNIYEIENERDSLNKAVIKLKSMDKQQKQFIGNVTHEFKTPITTIKAYADLINLYNDDLKLIQEGTISISGECDRLSDLVDKVLKLSALEKYDFEIKKIEVNLKEFLDDIISKIYGRIRKNNLTLYCSMQHDIKIIIDEEALKHIIINLLDNAIKYNKNYGTIEIKCYVNDSRVIIEIIDSGIGIDNEALPRIFDPFFRAESHRSHESGSIGLGLALVKKLVEKQNGIIYAKSRLNEGTSFHIEFPL